MSRRLSQTVCIVREPHPDLSTATDMLAQYLAAEAALLKGQSFRFGERMVTRADLEQIQKGRREWEARVAAEQRAAAGHSSGVALADFGGVR